MRTKYKPQQKLVVLFLAICLLLQLTGGFFHNNALAADDETWAIGDYFDKIGRAHV